MELTATQSACLQQCYIAPTPNLSSDKLPGSAQSEGVLDSTRQETSVWMQSTYGCQKLQYADELPFSSFKLGGEYACFYQLFSAGYFEHVVLYAHKQLHEVPFPPNKCVAHQGWGLNHSWVSESGTFQPGMDQGLFLKCHSQSAQRTVPGQFGPLSSTVSLGWHQSRQHTLSVPAQQQQLPRKFRCKPKSDQEARVGKDGCGRGCVC